MRCAMRASGFNLLQLLAVVLCSLVISVDCQAWNTDTNIVGINTHGAPAAITIGSQLYIFYEYSSGGQVNYATVPLASASGGTGWTYNKELQTQGSGYLGISGLGPTAAYDGSSWYVAHTGQGSSSDVYVTRGNTVPGDSANTVADSMVTGATTASYPMIAACAGTILLAWQGQTDNQVHFITSTNHFSTYSEEQTVSTTGGGVVSIQGGMSSICSNGVLYIFHVGSGSSKQMFMTTYNVSSRVWGVDGVVSPNTRVSANSASSNSTAASNSAVSSVSGFTQVQNTPGILTYYTAAGVMEYLLTWLYSDSMYYSTNSQLTLGGWSQYQSISGLKTTSGCAGAVYGPSPTSSATLCVHWAGNSGNALYIVKYS